MAGQSEKVRCFDYGDGEPPVCRRTGLSGLWQMRKSCDPKIAQATDSECFIIPEKAHFIPRKVWREWRKKIEEREKSKKNLIG